MPMGSNVSAVSTGAITGAMTVEVHDDPRVAAVAGWDALVRGDGAPVFYDSAYLAAYGQDPLTDIVRFGYLLARDRDGTPVGALPVALHRDPDPLGQLAHAAPELSGPALLSHVWHCYDARIVGAGRPDVVDALLRALARLAAEWGAGWYGLVNVDRSGPTAAALSGAGWTGTHLVDRWTADLTEVPDLPAFLARLGGRSRANLTRTARRAAEHGMVTTFGPPAVADLAEIAALCTATAARFGTGRFYPPETFARFVMTLGPSAHVIQVRQRGRLVAAGVCLADATRFHTWTCGVDYAVTGNASPYAVLYAHSVELALRLGRPVFEGGRGNEAFKRRHGLRPRPLDAYLRRTP